MGSRKTACMLGSWLLAWTLLGGLAAAPGRALAQTPAPPPVHYPPPPSDPPYDPPVEPRLRGVHEHDGFMLRLSTGPGAGLARLREPSGSRSVDVRNRGAALPGTLSLGGSLRGPWALSADLSWIALVRPHSRGGPGSDAQRIRDLALGLGLGLTRRLPSHFWVAASLGLALAVEDRDGQRPVQTNPGLGTRVAFGRGFWVAEQWLVGVGAQLSYVDARTRFAFDPGRMRLFAAALTGVVALH